MKTIIMFPGQGSQQPGMGADLFDSFPTETALANDILGYDVKPLCLAKENAATLNQTQYTQPLLFLVNALSNLKRKAETNDRDTIFIGHSLGEYNALHASGVFSLEVGLKLVKARGLAMNQAGTTANRPCGMLAVLGLTEEVIEDVLAKSNHLEHPVTPVTPVTIANLNATEQIILSGEVASLTALEEPLKKAGARKCIPLKVSGAFHSSYMQQALETMKDLFEKFTFNPPNHTVYANLTAQPYPQDEPSIKDILANQITHKVKWRETILNIKQTHPETKFIEVGPGNVLTNLLKRIS
ncbi:malonyl CoA-acyl carrier protein transacylase [Spirochaetota bacterium]|nr:malonyl CoA-acyl carrier protein transacylase [Spirochaetota bacterium]